MHECLHIGPAVKQQKAGAKLTQRDVFFEATPLGWACRYGRLELAKRLVKAGAPVNQPETPDWATPLAWAKRMERNDDIEYLSSEGATD